jgi:hypothetical protein
MRSLASSGALNPTQLPWGVHVSRHQSSGYGAGLIAPQTPRQLKLTEEDKGDGQTPIPFG